MNVQTAAFSVLTKHTHIIPHTGYYGYSNSVLRCHLGLRIPSNTRTSNTSVIPEFLRENPQLPALGLRCAQDVRGWAEGQVFLFDDMHIHEAWNFTDQDRVVLLLDLPRPEKYKRPPPPNADDTRYLDKLTEQYGY
eukprot:TRINITY_DN3979_c0_g1_i2.p1 TRINITY_DN3979_c0_g1~~TRINITY_DN3979_c0_g1_i2.p1  ORF type:complete len:136 (+),score=24.88 TRINITY_DN3979_c0_g1_i2:416-823(+)